MWTLKAIGPEEYDDMFYGTAGMDVKELFEREPESDEDALMNFFPSKLWRLNSGIYKIEDKEGNLIPFTMNRAQLYVYAHLIKHPRLIILKARQMGVSTFFLIYALDLILTEDNMKAGLMAQGLQEAKTLKERLERAYDNIPEQLLEFLGVKNIVRNNSEFSLNNDSKVYIATSFRSGTLQMLHISEFGKISAKNPEKAKETRTGSMQAIRGGLPVIVESTAEGRHNAFFELWEAATGHTGNMAPKDYMPVFLSCWDDPDCEINVPQIIDREAEEFFEESCAEYEKFFGRPKILKKQQKWWWVAQFREFGQDWDMINQEYPPAPIYAFNATKDGTYWAKLYNKEVVLGGHIVPDLYEPTLPVDVAVDLGLNDMMVLVFYQIYANELRVIDEYHNNGEGILHYVNKMKEKGYKYRSVWLPHDAVVRELGTGKSRYSIFRELGVPARLLPRTKSVQNDIELVRKAIPHIWLDEKNTGYIQQAFTSYSKDWDDRLEVFKDKPLHNEWSHPADAIRYMVVAAYRHIRPKGSAVNRGLVTKAKTTNVVDGVALI